MKLKKRKKSSRNRGARTCGWGARQRHKGHGCIGGHGMAGSGKRADHKKQKALMIAKKAGVKAYFGKQGLTSMKTERRENKVLNLDDIKNNFYDKDKIELKDYKILGEGEGFKAEIHAKSASKSAIEKMNKAGGKIIVDEIKVKKEVEKVVEKKEKNVQAKKEELKKEKNVKEK